ncbi:MAG: hypothetical protein U0800_23580 [Isosphaeraceae bacterium]
MPQMPPHAPEGWEQADDEEGCGYYRTVLSDADDMIFLGLFTRLGFGRPTASSAWSLVRGRPCGETLVPPHERAHLFEFVTNDSHARRDPLGVLTVRWRRLPTSPRLIDLEIVNRPPEDEAGSDEWPADASMRA